MQRRRDESLVYNVMQLQREGMKRRAIARALHVSRNTVRRIIEEHGEVRTREHSALHACSLNSV